MDNIYNEYKLTKQDIQALRKSDRVWVSYYNGESKLTAKIVLHNRELGDFERDYFIPVNAVFTLYDDKKEWGYDERKVYACSELCYLYENTSQKTVFDSLRAGDEITLEWIADGSNGYVKNARVTFDDHSYTGSILHHDRCHMIVKRGSKKLYYFLEESLCVDNSARMIKFSAYGSA
jgi:hypothetical protein